MKNKTGELNRKVQRKKLLIVKIWKDLSHFFSARSCNSVYRHIGWRKDSTTKNYQNAFFKVFPILSDARVIRGQHKAFCLNSILKQQRFRKTAPNANENQIS